MGGLASEAADGAAGALAGGVGDGVEQYAADDAGRPLGIAVEVLEVVPLAAGRAAGLIGAGGGRGAVLAGGALELLHQILVGRAVPLAHVHALVADVDDDLIGEHILLGGQRRGGEQLLLSLLVCDAGHTPVLTLLISCSSLISSNSFSVIKHG